MRGGRALSGEGEEPTGGQPSFVVGPDAAPAGASSLPTRLARAWGRSKVRAWEARARDLRGSFSHLRDARARDFETSKRDDRTGGTAVHVMAHTRRVDSLRTV